MLNGMNSAKVSQIICFFLKTNIKYANIIIW